MFEMTKAHYNAMFAICDGITDLKSQFISDMEKHNVDADMIKKVILMLTLTETPSKKFMTKDANILFYVITYLIHKLVINKNLFDKCFDELDKRSKKDSDINKEEYFNMRRINFEIKTMLDYIDRNDNYSLAYDPNTEIFTICEPIEMI
jgi:hypothetical protein